jgi:hypothetical protein
MTPKEKARELVSKFDGDLISAGWGETAFIDSKQCALIAVEELIKELFYNKYWIEVKQEIELL